MTQIAFGLSLLIAVIAPCGSGAQVPAAAADSQGPTPVASVASVDSASIVARIASRVSAFEAEFPGLYSRRHIKVRQLDPDDGTVESTKEIIARVWDFQGEAAQQQIVECRIDGELTEPEECRDENRMDPPHRIFGPDAKKYYRLDYVGRENWEGRPSHQIRVVPLEETTRHLKGDMYFLEDSLLLVGTRMTLADYPFGLKDLVFEASFTTMEGRPVLSEGKSVIVIYVPLLIHVRIVSDFKASGQRLLREREGPEGKPADATATAG